MHDGTCKKLVSKLKNKTYYKQMKILFLHNTPQ